MTGNIAAQLRTPPHEEVTAAAVGIYVQPNYELTEAEKPLTALAGMNAIRQVNGEASDRLITFGRNGSNLVIREPGVYSLGVFVEFTEPTPQNRNLYMGIRLYSVTGPAFSRRLWLFKRTGPKPEYSGSLQSFLTIAPGTPAMEFELASSAEIFGLATSVNLTRIYAEINAHRICSLDGGGPI